MKRRVPIGVVSVALLFVAAFVLWAPTAPVFAQSGPAGANDAGSGQDAGDSPADALPISNARRMWSGNLTPAGVDADWYRVAASGAFCASAGASTGSPGRIWLAGEADRSPSVSRDTSPHAPVGLALAAPAGSIPFFGVESASLMMASQGETMPSPGRYTFDVTVVSHAELDPEHDGESPEAGDVAATAAPLPSGCAAGRLDVGAGDSADRYFFDIVEPRDLSVSFAIAAGDDATVTVLTPSGAPYTTVANGGSADIWAAEEGRWSVVVELATAGASLRAPLGLGIALGGMLETEETDYLLGLTGPGEPQPCRPACLR